MFITTEGIVLRTHPFRDTKLIAKIFTKDSGLISCIIKKDKSQIILSQILTIAEITYKINKNQSLFYIKEALAKHVYKTLTINSIKIQSSMLLCEILNKCLNEKNLELYNFVTHAFKCLDSSKKYLIGFDSLFLIKLCEIMGFAPLNHKVINIKNARLNLQDGIFVEDVGQSKKNTFIPIKESYEIYKMSSLTFDQLNNYNLDSDLNMRIFNHMISYISTHIVDLTKLKSLNVLKELY